MNGVEGVLSDGRRIDEEILDERVEAGGLLVWRDAEILQSSAERRAFIQLSHM